MSQLTADTFALWHQTIWKLLTGQTLCAKSGTTPPSRTCTLTNTTTQTDVTDLMTKKYFPNNYDRIAKAPAQWFMSIDYEDFMDWKMNGWDIPESHDCIIRTINCKTGKVKEFVYQQHKSARKKVAKLITEQEEEFVICTHDHIQHMKPYKYLTDNEKKQIDPFE